MDYTRFITEFSAGRHFLPLRQFSEAPKDSKATVLALGNGAPNPNCFPFEEIAIKTKDGLEYKLDGRLLHTALGYGASPGMPELINWLKQMQIQIHNPPTADGNEDNDSRMELIVTPGSQDALSKCIEMMVQAGDYVLMEETAFPGVIAVLKPFRPKYLTLASDKHGLIPESIRKTLSSRWTPEDAQNPEAKMPKFLVVQPNHCNPTGVSMPLKRREEIYKIAQDWNLIIIEDDPYRFLTFGEEPPPSSFLSLDTDGRVLRLDSLSKVMSAGIRVGILTGPKALVSRILVHVASSSVQCSTLSQVIILELLKRWGYDGFLEHSKKAANFYESQCKKITHAAEAYLTGLAEWNVPTGGMFLWIKIRGAKKSCKMIIEKARARQVLLSPGAFFTVDGKLTSYLRASFSSASEEQMHEAFKRLADVIREQHQEERSG